MADTRKDRLLKLRTALTAELSRRNQSAMTYTDSTLDLLPIKAVHVQEIRNKIDTIKTGTYTDNPIVGNCPIT